MHDGKLRIGKVSYKNTLPLFHYFSLPDVELIEGTPQELARKISLGLIQGGIISSLFYLQHRGEYLILPDISISSFGRAGSVLIFSKKPLEEIGEIRPSDESLTSNFLTYTVFRKFLKIPVRFTETDETLLVIGDRALELLKEKRFPYVYDLGELWFQYTNLPAVFALFIVPKRWALENPDTFSRLSLELLNSKERFFKELPNLPLEAELKEYLKGLNYDFRERHSQSLDLMEKLLKEYQRGNF